MENEIMSLCSDLSRRLKAWADNFGPDKKIVADDGKCVLVNAYDLDWREDGCIRELAILLEARNQAPLAKRLEREYNELRTAAEELDEVYARPAGPGRTVECEFAHSAVVAAVVKLGSFVVDVPRLLGEDQQTLAGGSPRLGNGPTTGPSRTQAGQQEQEPVRTGDEFPPPCDRIGEPRSSHATTPEGEWSVPLSLTEMENRLGNIEVRTFKRLAEKKWNLQQVSRQKWLVRLDLMDSNTRRKIEHGR